MTLKEAFLESTLPSKPSSAYLANSILACSKVKPSLYKILYACLNAAISSVSKSLRFNPSAFNPCGIALSPAAIT